MLFVFNKGLLSMCCHFVVTLGGFGITLGHWGHIEIPLGSVWFDFEYMRFTWESLWSDFKKTVIIRVDFNDFLHIWGYLGVTLGAPGANLE